MTKTVTLKELRPNLPKIIQAVDKQMERYIITQRGLPKAIILSLDDFEGILETLEILQDKAGLSRLKKAEREAKAGKTRSLKEIHRDLSIV
jgi:prevent-host-death family protein